MNHAYRLVWSDALRHAVPVPECARGQGKGGGNRSRGSRSAVIAAAVIASLAGITSGAGAWAGPSGGVVSAGSGSISQSATTTTVRQSSQNLAINWTRFGVASGETVAFVQPNSSAIALNRVTGTESSVINGALTANGQVWILNANGVLFGSAASVNVGGLVASTLSLSDADFMAGKTRFSADGGQGNVVNEGSLTGGYVALLGRQVRNSGTITTAGGMSALAAGDGITLSFSGNALLSVQVDEGTYNALAENKGLIQADDGSVLLSAKAKDTLLDTVVNNSGIIQARGMSTDGGTIVLLGGFNGGTVNAGGTLDASSATHDGGFIETSGAHVQVAEGAKITTLSTTGRIGTWLVDPVDFTISSGTASQTNSGIGATTLSNSLASTNVKLQTDSSSGTDSGDINVNAAVGWSANTTLTLNAYNNINVNAAITATGANAGLVLNYGDYASASNARSGTGYNIAAPITLSGANASLAINGQAYTLVHSMSALNALDDASGNYALAQDLDAAGTTYGDSVVGGTFSGTFAGMGHTVSNLTIDAGAVQNLGLFSKNAGTIRDLGSVESSVSGGAHVGGLAGYNTGTISNAYATGDVSGDVSGSFYVGGLVGVNFGGTINNAYATGNVSSAYSAGGLAGYNSGAINNAYATGNVSGGAYAGGLVGINYYYGTINNAYATGSVAVSIYGGGLVAYNLGTISNAYWDSSTTGQAVAIGINSGTATNTHVTTATAYSHSSYANLGTWTEASSGSGVWVASNSGGTKQWVMIEGSTRPFLYSEYSTNIHNTHQLQLMAMNLGASYTLSSSLDASDANGGNASSMWTTSGFSPVGTASRNFTGSLDGAGHTISNLTINRGSTDYVGLFGLIGSGSSIGNVGIVDAVISGGSYVGGLVGSSAGTISDAYATGSVSGSNNLVGGLAGMNYYGTLSNVYAASSASGNYYVGGLVGYNVAGTISNAYATGRVSGNFKIGGLAGANYYGTISNAYATGGVSGYGYVGALVGDNSSGSISSSLWLTSQGTIGFNGGTVDTLTRGLTSIEANTASTYTTAGWDVATTGGSTSIWRIYEGSTTPLLRSFLTALTVTADSGGSKVYDGTTSTSGQGVSYSFKPDSNLLGTAAVVTVSKNVGTQATTVTGLYSNQQGYDISIAEGSTTITAKQVTGVITAADKTYDGTTAVATSGSLSGLLSSDVGSLWFTGSFADKNAGTNKTVTVSLTGAEAGNYTLKTIATTTANILAKAIVGAITATDKTYDGTTAAATSGSLIGVVTGDTVNVATTGSFTDKSAASSKTVTVSGSLSGADAGNYRLTTNATTTADILAKAIVGAITAANKTYDGTIDVTTSGSLIGVVSGDTVNVAATGSFSDKNAATGKTVAVSGSLSGTDAGNYTLSTNATTTADVLAKAIVGAITAVNKTYDGTIDATTSGSLAGVVGGDIVNLATTGSFGNKDAAAGKTVAVSGSLSGSDAGNYTLSTNATTAADILAKAIVGAITAANKTYDGTTGVATSGTLAGLVGSDAVTITTTGSFNDKSAATGKTVAVSGSLSGADAGNYRLTTNATTTADILAKAIVGAITTVNKTYDGTTAASTSGTLTGVVSGDVVNVATSGSFADKNAATGKTVIVSGNLTGTDAGNYTLTTNATTIASIAAAPLTITANDDSISIDAPAYSGGNGVRYSGFVAGEDAGMLVGTLVYGGSAQGAHAAGSYSIEPGGLSSMNYDIRQVDGTLVVTGSSGLTAAQEQAQQQYASASGVRQMDEAPQQRLLRIESCGVAGPACTPGR